MHSSIWNPNWTRQNLLGHIPFDDQLYFIRYETKYGWSIRWFVEVWENGQFITIPVLAQDILISNPGSLQTYTSNGSWNNVDNKIECIGGGGSGAINSNGSTTAVVLGGQGGVYAKITNFSFASPGITTAQYEVGIGGVSKNGQYVNQAGGDGGKTWFNAASDPGNGSDNSKCSANAGSGGPLPTSVGNGTQATGGWGQTINAGGAPGSLTGRREASGAGGAGGPSGTGQNGSNTNVDDTPTAGGTGDAGAGGAGTAAGNPSSAGGNGTEIDGVRGSGGGSGGSWSGGGDATSGSGGLYGGGSGGVYAHNGYAATSGAAGQGIIILTWVPIVLGNQALFYG